MQQDEVSGCIEIADKPSRLPAHLVDTQPIPPGAVVLPDGYDEWILVTRPTDSPVPPAHELRFPALEAPPPLSFRRDASGFYYASLLHSITGQTWRAYVSAAWAETVTAPRRSRWRESLASVVSGHLDLSSIDAIVAVCWRDRLREIQRAAATLAGDHDGPR